MINGLAYKNMVLCAHASLSAHKQQLNDMNVFPVPDGDTGTNMAMTMTNAINELNKKNPESLSDVAGVVNVSLCFSLFCLNKHGELFNEASGKSKQEVDQAVGQTVSQ